MKFSTIEIAFRSLHLWILFFFFFSTGLCDDSNIDVSNSAEKTYPINDMSISMTSASLSVPSRILTSVENERSNLLRDTKGETERDD